MANDSQSQNGSVNAVFDAFQTGISIALTPVGRRGSVDADGICVGLEAVGVPLPVVVGITRFNTSPGAWVVTFDPTDAGKQAAATLLEATSVTGFTVGWVSRAGKSGFTKFMTEDLALSSIHPEAKFAEINFRSFENWLLYGSGGELGEMLQQAVGAFGYDVRELRMKRRTVNGVAREITGELVLRISPPDLSKLPRRLAIGGRALMWLSSIEMAQGCCFECASKDHRSYECPSLPARTCFKCGGLGHFASKCVKQKESKTPSPVCKHCAGNHVDNQCTEWQGGGKRSGGVGVSAPTGSKGGGSGLSKPNFFGPLADTDEEEEAGKEEEEKVGGGATFHFRAAPPSRSTLPGKKRSKAQGVSKRSAVLGGKPKGSPTTPCETGKPGGSGKHRKRPAPVSCATPDAVGEQGVELVTLKSDSSSVVSGSEGGGGGGG